MKKSINSPTGAASSAGRHLLPLAIFLFLALCGAAAEKPSPSPVATEGPVAGLQATPSPDGNVGESPGDEALDAPDTSEIDSLFADPPESPAPVPTQAPAVSVQDKLETTKGVVIGGSFNGAAALMAGWASAIDWNDPWKGYDQSVGGTGTVKLTLDARPDRDFRLYGAVSTSLDEKLVWSGFSIDELFSDFSMGSLAYLRVGKTALAWGQGRIFSPANLADRASGYVLARLSFPVLANGLTGLVAANTSLYGSDATASYRTMYYAGKLDFVLGSVETSVQGAWQASLGARAGVTMKTVIFGVDLMAEACGGWVDSSPDIWIPKGMVGFYKDWKKPDIRVYGEYFIDAEAWARSVMVPVVPETKPLNHAFGFQFAWANVAGELDAGFRIAHSVTEGSGCFQLALGYPLWNHVRLSMALPVTYGANSAYYKGLLESDDKKTDSELFAFGVGIGLGLTLSASF